MRDNTVAYFFFCFGEVFRKMERSIQTQSCVPHRQPGKNTAALYLFKKSNIRSSQDIEVAIHGLSKFLLEKMC